MKKNVYIVWKTGTYVPDRILGIFSTKLSANKYVSTYVKSDNYHKIGDEYYLGGIRTICVYISKEKLQ